MGKGLQGFAKSCTGCPGKLHEATHKHTAKRPIALQPDDTGKAQVAGKEAAGALAAGWHYTASSCTRPYAEQACRTAFSAPTPPRRA